MNPKTYWKKGAVLLQTLVMSVILSLIAVMVLKWVLARYGIVTRVQRSSMANGRGVGYATSASESWNFGPVPSSGSKYLESDSSPQNFISFTVTSNPGGGSPKKIEVTYNED